MFNSMKKLIEKKYYKTANEAQVKIDVFFAMNRLSIEEFQILYALIDKKYSEIF